LSWTTRVRKIIYSEDYLQSVARFGVIYLWIRCKGKGPRAAFREGSLWEPVRTGFPIDKSKALMSVTRFLQRMNTIESRTWVQAVWKNIPYHVGVHSQSWDARCLEVRRRSSSRACSKLYPRKFILGSLKYAAISNRYESLPEVHPQTIEWPFHDSNDDNVSPEILATWLKTGTIIYCIGGKRWVAAMSHYLKGSQDIRSNIRSRCYGIRKFKVAAVQGADDANIGKQNSEPCFCCYWRLLYL